MRVPVEVGSIWLRHLGEREQEKDCFVGIVKLPCCIQHIRNTSELIFVNGVWLKGLVLTIYSRHFDFFSRSAWWKKKNPTSSNVWPKYSSIKKRLIKLTSQHLCQLWPVETTGCKYLQQDGFVDPPGVVLPLADPETDWRGPRLLTENNYVCGEWNRPRPAVCWLHSDNCWIISRADGAGLFQLQMWCLLVRHVFISRTADLWIKMWFTTESSIKWFKRSLICPRDVTIAL